MHRVTQLLLSDRKMTAWRYELLAFNSYKVNYLFAAQTLRSTLQAVLKDKVHPRTCHEGSEGEQIYSSTLPSTSPLDSGWVVSTTPRPLYPQERPGIYCINGWVGPRAGLDGCGKSCLHRDSIPGPSSPYRVAIPTEQQYCSTEILQT